MKVLIVGGNLGAVGLVEFLVSSSDRLKIDLATINPHHPCFATPGLRKKYIYQSGRLSDCLDIAEYDLLIPGSHDLYFSDLAYCKKDARLISMYSRIMNKSNLQSEIKASKTFSYLATHQCKAKESIEDFLDTCSANRFLLKPVLGSGGGSGIKFLDLNSLSNNSAQLLKERLLDGWILEEFQAGFDIAISMFIEQGELVSHYADFELLNNYRVVGSISNHEINRIMLPQAITIKDLLFELGFHDGFFHSQIRYESPSSWKIIELTCRMPGDIYWWPAEQLGISYRYLFIKAWTNDLETIGQESVARFNNGACFGRIYSPFLGHIENSLPNVSVMEKHGSRLIEPNMSVSLFQASDVDWSRLCSMELSTSPLT